MATNKPQLKTYVQPEHYDKFKTIAEKQHRTISNLLELLVIREIKNYESQNGIIKINTIHMNDNNGTINM